MRVRRFTGAVLAASGLACGLVACGSSGRSPGAHRSSATASPGALLARSTAAIGAVRTVRVAGVISGGDGPIGLSLRLVDGRGGTGTVTERGAGIQLVAVGEELYVRGGPAFWRRYGDRSVADRLAGRWLSAPAGHGPLASLRTLTDVHQLLAALLSGHGALSDGGAGRVDGRRVIAIRDASGRRTLDVAATGPPYPVRLVAPGGTLRFSDVDAPVTLAAPAGSVPLRRLAG